MTVARQIVGIGGAHRAQNQLVAHRAAVDEQILPERIGAGQRRRGGKALDHDTLAFCPPFDRARASCTLPPRAVLTPPPGPAIASRRTTSRMPSASVRSVLRNFSRAGVA